MLQCTICNIEYSEDQFKCGKYNRKKCRSCRNKESNEYKKNNQLIITHYNKYTQEVKKNNTEVEYICAQKIGTLEWLKFNSKTHAANELGIHASGIVLALKGKLKTSGGYIFKTIKERYTYTKTWEEYKKEHGIINPCKGKPSNHRTLHEVIDGVTGKKCCTCKEWKKLEDYNYDKSHWDNLRVECKLCIIKWRKNNRSTLSKKHSEYEKNRKMTDPNFKLVKTLRSRLGRALYTKSATKGGSTLELVGCSIEFLKSYLKEKFKEGMTWENHGKWHIDHIKPCCSFNLLDIEEQRKCFHYTNLQPLWAEENLSKGGKII